ncbi:MAG TPA: SusC/RagA family TonB-linked outer membrane protein, partial [Chitinophagaceae bacterium]|nr:SusC/RagA family TonB-linked outer membrane protein [Chitinophagaceae bacterium]
MSCRKLLKSIVVPVMLLFSQLIFAQDRVVSGRVTDSTGNGLSGVTVTARGSKLATQTNTDGAFRLTVPSTVDALIFSSIGFASQQVPIPQTNSINISMSGSGTSLNEVVVIGYGTVRKKDLTGSVTAISAKDFNKGSITTPEQLIAGKVAGVQIISNGGAPGSGSTIRIRGGASLNASNDPLIVIDGVPIAPNRNPDGSPSIAGSPDPLSLINPNDIESFNILKDASATAIYGSRASNGVIIITTKKGKSGKPRFAFTSQNSLSTLPKEADVLTPAEFRAYVTSHGTPAQIALMGGASTDWQKEIYDNAFSTDNNLSVSGTYKVLPYRISAGYLNQDGILKTGNLQRKSAAITINPRLFDDHLKIDLNLKGSSTNSRFADEGSIGNAVRFDPTQPVFSASKRFGGYFEWLDPASTTGLRKLSPLNPVGLLEQKQDESNVKRSIGNIQLDYKVHFLPDLHVNVNLGYDVSKGEGTIFIPDSAASSYLRSPDAKHGGVNNQYLQKNSN